MANRFPLGQIGMNLRQDRVNFSEFDITCVMCMLQGLIQNLRCREKCITTMW
jgi:hypothetical protein